MAIFGVFAGLVVQSATQIQTILQTDRAILYVLLGGSFLFLARGIFYSVKILSVTKQYRLTPDFIVEDQGDDIVESLRFSIAGVIWQYEQALGPNTTKLFWLNRAQRNGMIAVALFALYSFTFFSLQEQLFCVSMEAATLVGFALVMLLFFSDRTIEKFGIWRE